MGLVGEKCALAAFQQCSKQRPVLEGAVLWDCGPRRGGTFESVQPS